MSERDCSEKHTVVKVTKPGGDDYEVIFLSALTLCAQDKDCPGREKTSPPDRRMRSLEQTERFIGAKPVRQGSRAGGRRRRDLRVGNQIGRASCRERV